MKRDPNEAVFQMPRRHTPDPREFRVVQDRDGFYLEDDYGEDMTPDKCFRIEADAKAYQDELVKEYLDNYEPRETGDAWTGGFADNH